MNESTQKKNEEDFTEIINSSLGTFHSQFSSVISDIMKEVCVHIIT